MTPINLTIVRGKSASFNIDVTVNSGPNGSCIPADLTGATSIIFTAKESPYVPNIQFQKTANVNGGIIVLNAANGNLQLNLLPVDTQPAYQTANGANGCGWPGWGPPYTYPGYPAWEGCGWNPQEGGTLCVDLSVTFGGGYVYTVAAGTLDYSPNAPVNWANQ
jgi:hypothetical protein